MATRVEVDKLDKRRRKLARIRYEMAQEAIISRAEGVRELGQLGVRGLVLINGGALIGLFTFLGNNPALAGRVFAVGVLVASIAFVFGLVSALVALLIAYVSELENIRADVVDAAKDAFLAHGLEPPPMTPRAHRAAPLGAWGIVILALFVIGSLTAIVSVLF